MRHGCHRKVVVSPCSSTDSSVPWKGSLPFAYLYYLVNYTWISSLQLVTLIWLSHCQAHPVCSCILTFSKTTFSGNSPDLETLVLLHRRASEEHPCKSTLSRASGQDARHSRPLHRAFSTPQSHFLFLVAAIQPVFTRGFGRRRGMSEDRPSWK